MAISGRTSLFLSVLVAFTCLAGAQTAPVAVCGVSAPPFSSNAPNIFNDRQEQDLGDALGEFTESDMKLAPPAADDQLTHIGERLLATLPPTGIKYRFRIYDSGEINGFSIAGGRVYISRKLITAVKSEDDLAGVLAHEIGHISTHQTAIEITRTLRIRLGITQVTDRADIFAKVHLMFNTPAKPAEEDDKEDKDELLADHVALYAMVRAGYTPENFASFFNQITMNKGKTGNKLTDMFGITHIDSQRYRAALKLIAGLPADCKGKQPGGNDAFLAWQRGIVEERVKFVAEGVVGDQPVKLDPPLRPSLWRIRFSPNGRYLLAQDEGSISVVEKDSSKILFRIDAPDVLAAQFTPDSAEVVFHDSKLRVERWSVATGQRLSVKEMLVFDGCNETMLSPDGKTLVCVNINIHDDLPRVSLRLIDVETSKAFYDKPGFFQPSTFTQLGAVYALAFAEITGESVVTLLMSPDGRYLIAAIGREVLTYNLETRQPVQVGGKLKSLSQTRMAFLGPDQLFVVGESKVKDLYAAQVLSFPAGQLLKDAEIGKQQLDSVTNGRFITAGPIKDFEIGVLDPMAGKVLSAAKLPTIDVWDQTVAMENLAGGLALGHMGVNTLQYIALPLGPLPRPRAAAFSPDGKFLAVSVRTRAEVWDLDTGKQAHLLRPFRSAWIDSTDSMFVLFPKFMDRDPTAARVSLLQTGLKDLGKVDDKQLQYQDVNYQFKPMGKDKATNHHATLEVKNMETQAVLWSRDYQHETPAVWSSDDNRLVLAWDLSCDTAKAEIKTFSGLQREIEALKEKKKGLLIETVNAQTGAPDMQVIVPVADLTGGWNDERRATVSGKYVLAQGEHGNTVIYQMETGIKVGEFFGAPITSNAAAGLVAATNREDEILIVQEQTGQELKRFSLGSPVRTARIVNGKQNTLLVLTADQVVHKLPLSN